jgi:DNA-binding GntR family transcriptional regulator
VGIVPDWCDNIIDNFIDVQMAKPLLKQSAATRGAPPSEEKLGWQQVADELQRDVIFGRLQPREHLVEDDVMQRFGVSRYAVRRAFDELQQLGLVARSENRGTRIRGYSPQEVADLYDLRHLLETGAALRIPMPPNPRFIDELVALQKQHDAALRKGDLYRMHQMNEAFHLRLFSACPNRLLVEDLKLHALRVQPVRMRFMNDEHRRVEAGQEHWEMIDALKAGDSKLLAKVCGKHLSLSKAAYMKAHPLAQANGAATP